MGLTQVSTDGVKNDAITKTKIPANQIEASELADNAVDTNAIQNDAVTGSKINANAVGTTQLLDTSVTLAKLEHGTSSNDGKFLRANNGADPSFETVSIPAGTTINSNANNRVITGSGTANTLEGESNLTFTGSNLTITNGSGASELTVVTPNNTDGGIYFNDGSNSGALSYQHSDNSMRFRVNATEKMRINSSGNVGIGTASPDQKLKIQDSNDLAIHLLKTGVQDTLIKNTGQTEICAATGGASGQRIAFKIGANTGSLADIAKFTPDGLCFGSDTAAANALDDYEEGTWSPTTSGTISNAGTFRNCRYVKVGAVVHLWFDWFQNNNNMAVGNNTQIRNLPFIPTSAGYLAPPNISTFSYTSSQAKQVTAYLDNGNNINFYAHGYTDIRHVWGQVTYITHL